MHYDIIIIGGGPAGLACATTLASQQKQVLLLERKDTFGPKVCAGGITWSGLIKKVPASLIEKQFPTQHLKTPFQDARIVENDPIIATVNRAKLGSQMAQQALQAGANLRSSCRVVKIGNDGKEVVFEDNVSGKEHVAHCDVLIGADGATSRVRKHLGIPTENMGLGINYQLPGTTERMEWHLDWTAFRNGYGWIFPHSDSTSIGAYVDRKTLPAGKLKASLLLWAEKQGYSLSGFNPRAEFVNYDYRGWNFGNVFLIGEAAGFASGLTGEGIYPAIVSGEMIGGYVANRKANLKQLERLISMHKFHSDMVQRTGRNRVLASCLFEMVTLLLRLKILRFTKLEMAH